MLSPCGSVEATVLPGFLMPHMVNPSQIPPKSSNVPPFNRVKCSAIFSSVSYGPLKKESSQTLIDLERTFITRYLIGIGLPHATKRFEIVSHFLFYHRQCSRLQVVVRAKNNRHSSNKHAGVTWFYVSPFCLRFIRPWSR